MKKANDLASLCHTDLYLVIYKGERYYTYSSTNREAWPPSEKDMVGTRSNCSRIELIWLTAHSLSSNRS